MTIKTFWTILLKIVGLYLVLGLLVLLQPIYLLTSHSSTFTNPNILEEFFIILGTIGIYILIISLLVFRTEWIIDKLHLDKGFTEEKIEFNISKTVVLTIATIVLGGLLFIDALPALCKQIFSYLQLYQQKSMYHENPSFGWIIFYVVKIVLGYLLMTKSHYVVSLIEKETKNEEVVEV
jgi:hypothetical protein